MAKKKQTVLIDKAEYDQLLLSDRKLDALERWGVDNWGGYGDAMKEVYGENGDND